MSSCLDHAYTKLSEKKVKLTLSHIQLDMHITNHNLTSFVCHKAYSCVNTRTCTSDIIFMLQQNLLSFCLLSVFIQSMNTNETTI